MRTLKRNNRITVLGIKRHRCMLLSDTGKNYTFLPNYISDSIPMGEWRYWTFELINNQLKVIKIYGY